MPAQSKQQQKFMGMVHALQKGDMKPSDASPEVKKAAASMKKSDAKDFASTKHKGLPRKVKQELLTKLKEYANKMGTNTMGGDDYTSSKKGGLRDNDGYDNVDYNPNNQQEEGKLPNNWMSGRTSDYHTQLRGKKREYDDTNFKKDNSGQPDLKEAPIFHAMNNPRFKKATKDLVKNKKVKNPDTGQDVQLTTALKDKEHPAHKQAKSLFKRLFGEYASKQTLSYIPADEEEIEKMNETMIRRAVDIAQELLPKDTFSRYSKDGQKNKEFVKNVVRDLTQSLNRFYKNHDISVRIKEEEGDSNVDMVLGVLSILRQIEDKENRKKVAVDMIKKFKEQNIDFDYKEFLELMKDYNK